MKLPAGGIVRGTVVDATGAGVGGAVGVGRPAAAELVATVGVPTPEATTDASGAFELRGVERGQRWT